MKTIYAAVFADGVEVTLDVLETIAGNFDVTRERISDALDGGAALSLHNMAISTALDLGVSGVPSFVCGEEVFWGNDQLGLLIEHEVAKQGTGLVGLRADLGGSVASCDMLAWSTSGCRCGRARRIGGPVMQTPN